MRVSKDGLDRVRQRVRVYAGKRPALFYGFYGLCGLRHEYRLRGVSRTTQLVIEGFPRSANTFAVVAFLQAQAESVRIAHHLHAPAQIIRAVQWQIPTIVLIREPADAILSQVVRRPQIPVLQALSSYISFYEAIAKYRDAYIVGAFQEVAKDYGAVIERVNAKFDTRFFPFEHTVTNVREVFTAIEILNFFEREGLENQVSRPSVGKEKRKDEVQSALKMGRARSLLPKAEAVYCDLALNERKYFSFCGR